MSENAQPPLLGQSGVSDDEFEAVRDLLSDSLTPRGIRQWLSGRNRYLDGAIPVEVLRDGDVDRVREAALAFDEGSYL